MKKILHIGEYVQGGIATYLKTILNIDHDTFDEYIIMSREKSDRSWNIPESNLEYYSYKRGLIGVIHAVIAVQRYIKKIKPDIIYCHSTWAGVIGRIAFFLSRVDSRIIYNAHGWSFTMDVCGLKKKIYGLIEIVLSLITDVIINVSEFEYLSASRMGINKKKMKIIYSGTKKPDNIVIHNDVYDNRFINLLFVGRFDPQKGVDILLKTFKNVKNNNIRLYLAGGTVVSNDIYNINEDERIKFLGWISHNEIEKYYCGCDAVIMPSRWEAFGLVAIEAMKYGKPVIVSNRGALPELVKDCDNGYVFDMSNVHSLEHILCKLDKNKLRKMGKHAYFIFKKKYTVNQMRYNTKQVYNMIIQEMVSENT